MSFLLLLSCSKKEDERPAGLLQLSTVKVGTIYLSLNETKADIPVNQPLIVEFNSVLDTNSVKGNISLITGNNEERDFFITYMDELRTIVILPDRNLKNFTEYSLNISSGLKGRQGESFPGVEYRFKTMNGEMLIQSILINQVPFTNSYSPRDIDFSDVEISITFSHPLNPSDYKNYFSFSGNTTLIYTLSQDSMNLSINTSNLEYYKRYFFTVSENLKARNGFIFNGFSGSFYTGLDSSFKFPQIPDEELLTLIQRQTFKYFWDFAHPVSGLSRERNTSGDVVTTGGTGFGILAMIVGIERNFISRSEGIERLDKIVSFLETCDRFHGSWPHWLNGNTGKIVPFSPKDDGGDLVETSFLIEGLITMHQYLNSSDADENNLKQRISRLADSVEYDFYTKGENALYWHWSPNYGWAMNMKIQGYNEAIITYVLGASSKTHGISSEVYKQGFTKNGSIVNGRTYYGYKLPLGSDYGGPLFFSHYSFLGLDPRNLKDNLANYMEQNMNHSLINWAYCVDNPKEYIGYNEHSWGLTASDNPWGYNAHSPTNDLGVITPSAAISSIAYTPVQSLNAIKHFYYILGDRLWGEYGFYDAFNVTEGWWSNSFIAIDQGPIICMIENYRTGLLWELFMSNQDIKTGLGKLGFTY